MEFLQIIKLSSYQVVTMAEEVGNISISEGTTPENIVTATMAGIRENNTQPEGAVNNKNNSSNNIKTMARVANNNKALEGLTSNLK